MKGFLCLLFSLLVGLASAGQYMLTDISGGISTSTSEGDYDYAESFPVDPNDYDYGGGVFSDGGETSNGGTVTYTFEWQPAFTGDSAPVAVSVFKKARCQAHTDDLAGTTRINTGFGGADVTTTNGAFVYGQSTKVQTGGDIVYVTLSPSASSTSTWPAGLPPGYNYSDVATFARIKPIYIKLEGIKSHTDKRLLIGQKLKATVMVGDEPAEGLFNWDVKAGAPFVLYASTTPSSYVKYNPLPESISPSTSFYLAKPGLIRINCEAVIHSAEVNLEGKVTSVAPYFNCWAVQGHADVVTIPTNNGDLFGLWLWNALDPLGDPNDPNRDERGIWMVGEVNTPPDFAAGGSGQWYWTQLMNGKKQWLKDVSGSYYHGSQDFVRTNDASGAENNARLDYGINSPSYAYAALFFPANGDQAQVDDAPGMGLPENGGAGNLLVQAYSGHYFHSFLMYTPPGATQDVQDVPLQDIRWQWYGISTRDALTHNWLAPASGRFSQLWYYVTTYPKHPKWINTQGSDNIDFSNPSNTP